MIFRMRVDGQVARTGGCRERNTLQKDKSSCCYLCHRHPHKITRHPHILYKSTGGHRNTGKHTCANQGGDL